MLHQRNLINVRESFLPYRFVLVLSSSDHCPFATKIHLLSLCDHILILSLFAILLPSGSGFSLCGKGWFFWQRPVSCLWFNGTVYEYVPCLSWRGRFYRQRQTHLWPVFQWQMLYLLAGQSQDLYFIYDGSTSRQQAIPSAVFHWWQRLKLLADQPLVLFFYSPGKGWIYWQTSLSSAFHLQRLVPRHWTLWEHTSPTFPRHFLISLKDLFMQALTMDDLTFWILVKNSELGSKNWLTYRRSR